MQTLHVYIRKSTVPSVHIAHLAFLDGIFSIWICHEVLHHVVDLCSKAKCQRFAVCQVQADTAVCICPKCEEVYAPVCGTDGLTYASDCYLKETACKLSTNVNFGKNIACGM